MRIKHEYAAAISGGGNGSAAEVGQTFTIDKVRKLGGFYMSSGSYLLDENLVIGTTYKITGVGDTYWDIEPVIKDEDSSLPDQSKWLKVYYFNLFSGYDNATQDKFKAGSSYLVVKVEGPHSWLVEQSDVVKVAPCPVCGEALNSAGECSINNCRWIKDEPSTLKANQYRVHCRCNYPVKTGLEPLAIGNIVHYHCTDQDGHYWLKEGLASLKLPLGKELDSSKIFKIVTIDNDDYWTIEELESVPGMVEVFMTARS